MMDMRSFRRKLIVAGAVSSLFAPAVHALTIRGYAANPSRYDRFTNFPTAPVLNTGSWFTGANYTGMGWMVEDARRQFALVSPQHFVMASHFGVVAGQHIRFLSSTGQLVTATIDSSTVVKENPTDTVATDLTLGRFSAPIPAGSGVAVFPYLNHVTGGHLNENSYLSAGLQVFGMPARGGSGTLVTFNTVTLSDTGSVSRMYNFNYDSSGSGVDDCTFQDGDSGSPTFCLLPNSKPALMGTHTATGTTGTVTSNYDTFVPHYVSQLNALMAADGYQMFPSTATATTFTATETPSPTPLRRLNAGTATFNLQNSGSQNATNVSASLTFPAGAAPSSVSGSGWVADTAGPLIWTFHRVSLNAAMTASLTATWSSVPAVSSLVVGFGYQSDANSLQTSSFDLAPAASYAEWSNALAQPATTADPDHDDRNNLAEYAFGGDPLSGGNSLSGTVAVDPVLRTASGTATLRFPVRADSQVRGLTYRVEYSTDLATWTQTAPSGTAISYAAYSPAISGFKESTVTFPVTGPRKFARVRVTLDETTAGMTVP